MNGPWTPSTQKGIAANAAAWIIGGSHAPQPSTPPLAWLAAHPTTNLDMRGTTGRARACPEPRGKRGKHRLSTHARTAAST